MRCLRCAQRMLVDINCAALHTAVASVGCIEGLSFQCVNISLSHVNEILSCADDLSKLSTYKLEVCGWLSGKGLCSIQDLM